MTPLKAMERLSEESVETVYADDYTGNSWNLCKFCLGENCHKENCLTHSFPKIVAALEAAQRVVEDGPGWEESNLTRLSLALEEGA